MRVSCVTEIKNESKIFDQIKSLCNCADSDTDSDFRKETDWIKENRFVDGFSKLVSDHEKIVNRVNQCNGRNTGA